MAVEVGEIVDELVRSRAHVALWDIAKWATLGAFGGLVAGAAVFLALRKGGAFELAWRHAAWARRAAALWILLALGACGGLIGGCEGASRGITRVATESQFRTEVLQPAAEAAAVGFAWVDAALADIASDKSVREAVVYARKAEAFRQGEATFDGEAFFARLEKAEEPAIQAAADLAKAHVHAKLALSKGDLTAKLVDAVLEQVVPRLVHKAVDEKLVDLGVAEAVREFRETMPKGPLTRQTLADHIAEHAEIPLLMTPVRGLIRAKQTLVGVLGGVALVLPVLAFWIGRKRSAQGAGTVQA